MMKKLRRHICLLLIAALALSLCACGGRAETETTEQSAENTASVAEAKETAAATPAAEDDSPVISVLVESTEEAYPFPTGTSIKSIARIGSNLLLLAEREETIYLGLCEYSLAEDGQPNLSELKELQIVGLPYDEAIPYAVTAGGDGYFYLLSGNNEGGASTALCIQKYSSAGEYIESMEITDWDLLTADAFAVGAGGEVVLAADDTGDGLPPEQPKAEAGFLREIEFGYGRLLQNYGCREDTKVNERSYGFAMLC